MTIPSYGEKSYWEQRYKDTKGGTFEWYGDWLTVKPFLQKIECKKDSNVLHIGCGSSTLAKDMHENGFRNNQFCVDFVDSVVKEMRKRSEETRPEIKYETMDITDSAFKSHMDATFHLVLDKVRERQKREGCLLCLSCGESNPTESRAGAARLGQGTAIPRGGDIVEWLPAGALLRARRSVSRCPRR